MLSYNPGYERTPQSILALFDRTGSWLYEVSERAFNENWELPSTLQLIIGSWICNCSRRSRPSKRFLSLAADIKTIIDERPIQSYDSLLRTDAALALLAGAILRGAGAKSRVLEQLSIDLAAALDLRVPATPKEHLESFGTRYLLYRAGMLEKPKAIGVQTIPHLATLSMIQADDETVRIVTSTVAAMTEYGAYPQNLSLSNELIDILPIWSAHYLRLHNLDLAGFNYSSDVLFGLAASSRFGR